MSERLPVAQMNRQLLATPSLLLKATKDAGADCRGFSL